MKPEPSIFEIDDQEDARRDAEALADIEAQRVVAHAEVKAWLSSWGMPEEKPAPETWLK